MRTYSHIFGFKVLLLQRLKKLPRTSVIKVLASPRDALRHPAVAYPVPPDSDPPGTAAALNRLESFRPQAAHSQPSAPAEHLSGNRLHPLGSPPPPYLVFLPMIHMSCILISRKLRPVLPHCGKSSKRNRSAPNRAAETPL